MKSLIQDVFISLAYLAGAVILTCCAIVVVDATIHQLNPPEGHCRHHIHT